MSFPIITCEENSEISSESAWPLVRDLLWKRWYAKIWWLGIALFWIASGLFSWLHFDIAAIDEPYEGCISLFLNPIAATITLSGGAIRSMLMEPAGGSAEHYDPESAAASEDKRDIPLRSSLLHPNRANALSNPNNPLSPFNSWRCS